MFKLTSIRCATDGGRDSVGRVEEFETISKLLDALDKNLETNKFLIQQEGLSNFLIVRPHVTVTVNSRARTLCVYRYSTMDAAVDAVKSEQFSLRDASKIVIEESPQDEFWYYASINHTASDISPGGTEHLGKYVSFRSALESAERKFATEKTGISLEITIGEYKAIYRLVREWRIEAKGCEVWAFEDFESAKSSLGEYFQHHPRASDAEIYKVCSGTSETFQRPSTD